MPASINSYTHFLCVFLLVVSFFSPTAIQAQGSLSTDARCYVVVGAFNLERNASNYKGYMERKSYRTQYKKNTHRNLFYVYIFDSKDREKTKQYLFKFRDDNPAHSDSWLYAGNFRGPHIPSDQWISTMVSPEATIVNEPVIEEPSVKEDTPPVVLQEEEPEPELALVVEKEEVPEVPPLKEGEYRLYVNAYDATSLKEIAGQFIIMDGIRNKEILKIDTHTPAVFRGPDTPTKRITVQSDIFDFREGELTFDLTNPTASGDGAVEITGDTILVDFPLLRYNKGDIVTLWKVYFYKDAAIMREESLDELNQLLRMLQSNPNMKIMVHGHTNGNSSGKVLYLDEGDKDFFALKGKDHQEVTSSAKKLSEYRAYTIQQWLIAQGITTDRMEIKGWGGKKMLHDKHDSQAHKNVRVDIEIME